MPPKTSRVPIVEDRAGRVIGDGHAESAVRVARQGGLGVTFGDGDVTEERLRQRRQLAITDAIRQRIGADLHDGLGQQLTGLACQAAALRDRLRSAHPAEAAQADLIARLANDAIRHARALIRGLGPVALERTGLPAALEELADQTQLLFSVTCRFRKRGRLSAVDSTTAVHLYRIVQEAIHNAVRHGGARAISVTLVSRDRRHRLTIRDNGAGFDPGAQRAAPDGGLRLMNDRATAIGARFSVASQPGGGTRVACSFCRSPYDEPTGNPGSRDDRAAQAADLPRR